MAVALMGRSHLVAGTSLAVGLAVMLDGLTRVGATMAPDGTTEPNPEVPQLWWPVVDRIDEGATWLWTQLLPHHPATPAGMLYLAVGAALFWLGSLLPDIDSRSSMLGRYLHWPGPHHGLPHTDWMLWLLALSAVPDPTRVMFFCWLGAWLHCELDSWSMAGRVRYWPLTDHKTITLGSRTAEADGFRSRSPERCVVVRRPRPLRYKVGKPSEGVAVALSVAVGALLVTIGTSL